jgi:hypothetical protein
MRDGSSTGSRTARSSGSCCRSKAPRRLRRGSGASTRRSRCSERAARDNQDRARKRRLGTRKAIKRGGGDRGRPSPPPDPGRGGEVDVDHDGPRVPRQLRSRCIGTRPCRPAPARAHPQRSTAGMTPAPSRTRRGAAGRSHAGSRCLLCAPWPALPAQGVEAIISITNRDQVNRHAGVFRSK